MTTKPESNEAELERILALYGQGLDELDRIEEELIAGDESRLADDDELRWRLTDLFFDALDVARRGIDLSLLSPGVARFVRNKFGALLDVDTGRGQAGAHASANLAVAGDGREGRQAGDDLPEVGVERRGAGTDLRGEELLDLLQAASRYVIKPSAEPLPALLGTTKLRRPA